MAEFDWPCDLRIAHGPHLPVMNPEEVAKGWAPVHRQCPGVKAHPKTMIGGKIEDD